MEDIRKSIISGAASVHRTLSEDTILALVQKTMEKDVASKKNYAFISGRNAAVTLNRREKYQAKLALLNIQKAEEAQRQAEQDRLRAEEIQGALTEFLEVLPKMREALLRRNAVLTQMGLDILRSVLEKDQAEYNKLQEMAPNMDYFYQARRRALVRTQKFLSEKNYWVLESLKNVIPE